MRLRFLLGSGLYAFSTLAGAAAEPPSAEARPNIVLITIDTLRADHLSCYGYHLKTSPTIDKLAEDGVRFENAYSPIPLTGPSHTSLFTSRFPQEHGARINGYAVPKDSQWLSLPQILKRFGYQNGAFVSAWPLTSRLTHLDRWFDLYDEDLSRKYQVFNSSRYAEDVTPLAVSWLEENRAGPFFLWVHYFDPHSPYNLREDFAEPESSGHPNSTREPLNREMANRIKKYDAEIGYADFHIGKLLARLDELGLKESTLVVLTSDHGESLGEHGYVGHGRQLSEGIVHIPLIMRYPARLPAGKVISSNVSLLDATPTILELAVGPQPDRDLPTSFAGRSLASAMIGQERIPQRPIRYITFGGKKGWMPRWFSHMWVSPDERPLRLGQNLGSQKMVWNPGARSLSVFNIEEDPFEMSPLVFSHKNADYSAKARPLGQWFQATDLSAGDSKLTKRDLEILKTLGYIH